MASRNAEESGERDCCEPPAWPIEPKLPTEPQNLHHAGKSDCNSLAKHRGQRLIGFKARSTTGILAAGRAFHY
jgi:hypothetical protein